MSDERSGWLLRLPFGVVFARLPALSLLLPFALVALIWGSTWWVITGQIHNVPLNWSIAYRFALATPAMFALALIMGKSLSLGRKGHMLALLLGITQFVGNFHFVYRAELHLTSGIVAVMFGMLMLPNLVFGRIFLGESAPRGFFLGSLVAIAGIAILLVHEGQVSRLNGDVLLGASLAMGDILAASLANVIQGNPTGRALPMVSLLAFSMAYGTIIDIGVAWAFSGPPIFPNDPQYWLGASWLAFVGSVVTFPLYYTLVRRMGAGRAAYNSVAVIVVAMLISTLLEGYQWSLLAVGGAGLALIGMVLALKAKQQ